MLKYQIAILLGLSALILTIPSKKEVSANVAPVKAESQDCDCNGQCRHCDALRKEITALKASKIALIPTVPVTPKTPAKSTGYWATSCNGSTCTKQWVSTSGKSKSSGSSTYYRRGLFGRRR